MNGNKKYALKYNPLLLGTLISILLFLGLYFAESWSIDLPGIELSDGWEKNIGIQSEFNLGEKKWAEQAVPFHNFTEKSCFINLKYVFDNRMLI